ncbi:MAG: phasin family protein [Rhodospirillales bacterium]|nr:phasin family protein [Rhodospirillales bacterium]
MAQEPKNPFMPMDFSKMMAGVQMPGIDMNAMMSGYSRNIEALTEANRRAYEGMQAVMTRQAEIFKQTMEEAAAMSREMATQKKPEEMVAKQTELARAAFERALSNMRELAEMVTKANREATDVINKRIAESLAEVRSLYMKK